MHIHIHIDTCVYMQTQNKWIEIQCKTSTMFCPCQLFPYMLGGVA